MKRISLDQPIPGFILVLLALALWGGEYIRRDLWSPDEARYALISREMRTDSHWLIPYRQGEFYTHKPPLMFWLTNAGVAAGFPERVAARLPSFLGALMALWTITRLAARWSSPRTSWWVALFLPTSFLFWNKGGFGQIDALLCGLEMMGLYFLFTSSPTCAARRIPAYLFFGLAVLAKGPVGLLVPMLAYAIATWAAGDTRELRGWHWLWGPLLALTIPALWLLAAWRSGAPDGFFPELLFKQNIGRATGEFGGHAQPWYYYLLYFPLDFMPWAVLLPLAVVTLARRDETLKNLRRLLGWIFAVVLFFSLSGSKRNLYILLAHPAAALLVASSIPNWLTASPSFLKRCRIAAFTIGFIATLGLAALPFIPRAGVHGISAAPAVAALAIGLFLSIRAARAQPDSPRWCAILLIAIFVAFANIGAWIYSDINAAKTPRAIIPVAQRTLPENHYMILFKEQGEIISLYAQRPGRMAYDADELRALLSAQDANLIVTDVKRLDELQEIVGTNHPHGFFTTGSKRKIWLTLTTPESGELR